MNFIDFLSVILIAISLSFDTLAVTVCGSLKLGKISLAQTLKIASIFALVQAVFIFGGWLAGYSVMGFVEKWAPYIAFGLLLYIGGSMIFGALRHSDKEETVNLSGLSNLFLAGVATSIDAVAVGASMAMDKTPLSSMAISSAIVFIITMLFAITGITFGRIIGTRFEKTASILGGLVLIGIGVNCLL